MLHFQQGDARAFEVLLERHRRPVYNFLFRLVHHQNTAEDLLQDTFLRVVHKASSYKTRSKFTTWLYTIARNLAIDHARKAKHRRTLSLDQPLRPGESDTTYLSLVPAKGGGGDSQLADKEFAHSLYAALEELPAEQREVFLLREFHSLRFREIADIVGVPVNTVKSRMRYALDGLRRRLTAHYTAAPDEAEQAVP